MNQFHRTLAILAVLMTMAGCASSPVTLVTLPPAPAAVPRNEQSTGVTVRVRDVKLPGYLESFPVVIGRADHSLVVAQNVEWAERLSEGVSRVLRDALSQRLTTARVLVAGERRLAEADLLVEFSALDPRDGALDLDARWWFSCTPAQASRGGRTHLRVRLERPSAPAVAAATTEALARFADVLATEIECSPNSDRMATLR
jgi:uncharacterized lipoprotein YmbA